MVYFYPQKSQVITLNVGQPAIVTQAIPHCLDGWTIEAKPDGTFIMLGEDKTYQALFWEGLLPRIPEPESGFVIGRDEIPYFLIVILARLGLNNRESEEFIRAWTPQLCSMPFAFITFHDKAVIDAIAPMKITPTPDTLIRILMEYKPLATNRHVQTLNLPEPPVRRGFTVVEWGGIER